MENEQIGLAHADHIRNGEYYASELVERGFWDFLNLTDEEKTILAIILGVFGTLIFIAIVSICTIRLVRRHRR